MENLNEALATLIEQALSGIDASVEFLQAEIPDVIVQLLMWNAVKSGIWFVVGIVLMLFSRHLFGFLSTAFKQEAMETKKAYEDGEGWTRWVAGSSVTSTDYDMIMLKTKLALPLGVAAFFIGFLIAESNLTWLQIWIAPKVWLLEYAANLVK